MSLRNRIQDKVEEALENYDWDDVIDDALSNVDMDEIVSDAISDMLYRENPFNNVVERKVKQTVTDILEDIDFEEFIDIY